MVKIIIDSAADILPSECQALGIRHLPLKVFFGQKEYRDAVDLSHKEFYEKLVESDELPTTSQISPAEFADAMEEVVSAGDEALVITLSSRLSGTYQSAMIAAADFEGKVFVVDSLNVSLGMRLLVQRGITLVEQGLSAAEIARLEKEMKEAAKMLEFEYAAVLRDRIIELKGEK